MQSIAETSSLTVIRRFDLSPADEQLLACAYLPVIGPEAFALYFALYNNPALGPQGDLRFGQDLQAVVGYDFVRLQQAKRRLEGIGLLTTQYRQTEAGEDFLLILNPPKTPRQFFADPALKALLLERVSPRYVQNIENLFVCDLKLDADFADISETLNVVYAPASQLAGYLDPLLDRLTDKDGERIDFKVDEKALGQALAKVGMTLKILNKDKEKVLSLIAFFGLKPAQAASLIQQATSSKNAFLLCHFEQLCRDTVAFNRVEADERTAGFFGNTKLAVQFATMDRLTTPVFLAALLKIPKAPESLVNLAEQIQERYGFNRGVVNTIFDYAIRKAGGVPADSYFEKVALSVVPKAPQNAYETALIFKNGEEQRTHKKQQRQELEIKSLLKTNNQPKAPKKKVATEDAKPLVDWKQVAKELGL